MLYTKHSHCSYCGNYYGHLSWPRTCPNCSRVTYRHPQTVVVALQPVDDKLLMIRRADSATYNKLALPGGMLEVGESWETACVRELFEETGIVASVDDISHYMTTGTADGTLLIIVGQLPKRTEESLEAFVDNTEVLTRVLIDEPCETAFAVHDLIVNQYFGVDTE